MTRYARVRAVLAALTAAGIGASIVLAASVAGATASPAAATALWVSPSGSDGAACTKAAPCKTIGHAVAQAAAGSTVYVEAGTYHEMVTIDKNVRLIGKGKPMIDATGQINGILIKGAGAAGAGVAGFTVENATQEGILAQQTSWVGISENTVQHNDLGASVPNPTGECAAQGEVPGDCGEGLHLMSVTQSVVSGNTVTGNSGGILLTDELGPTAGNLITHNQANDNVDDCGITLAGHNPKAIANGQRESAVAGVYDNIISHNTANGNGVKGQGAGIGLFAGAPGTGVYENVVSENTASGNGLPGVTLHSHAPHQDDSNNVIVDNVLSNNAIHGYPNGDPGDSDSGLKDTTGIEVWSAVSPITGTVIAGNRISKSHYGVWMHNAVGTPPQGNRLSSDVAVAIGQG